MRSFLFTHNQLGFVAETEW